jgi:hypothetical protein
MRSIWDEHTPRDAEEEVVIGPHVFDGTLLLILLPVTVLAFLFGK